MKTDPHSETPLVEAVEHRGVPIAVLTMNRPQEHNPVDETMIATLETAIQRVLDEREARALVSRVCLLLERCEIPTAAMVNDTCMAEAWRSKRPRPSATRPAARTPSKGSPRSPNDGIRFSGR